MAEAGREHAAAHVAQRRVAFHAGPQCQRLLRRGAVQREVVAGVELLARHLDALAELLGALGLRQQRGRHRLASGADVLEQGQHARVEDPGFEHLRRRFDEVALHIGAGLAGVARGRQQRVQRVAELVQQRVHFVQRQALAIEVDHQPGRRQPAGQGGHAAKAPDRRVLVFVGARVQVNEQGAQRLARRIVTNFEGACIGMPQRLLHRREADTEQLPREPEHEGQAFFGREVGAELLLVDRELRPTLAGQVESGIPSAQHGRLQWLLRVFGLAGAQHRQIFQLALANHVAHAAKKALHLRFALGHAPAQGEVGIGVEAEQAGVLSSQARQLSQQRQVVGAALVLECPPHSLARCRVTALLQHREQRRVVQAQQDATACVALRVLPDGRRHTGQLALGERHLGFVFADAPLEVLRHAGDLCVDVERTLFLVGRQRHA